MCSDETDDRVPSAGRPLASRVVLVSGGAGGLGSEIVAAVASAGAEVAVTAREVSRLEPIVAEVGHRGTRAVPIAMDLRDRASITAAAETVMDTCSRSSPRVALDAETNTSGMSPSSRTCRPTDLPSTGLRPASAALDSYRSPCRRMTRTSPHRGSAPRSCA